VVKQNAHVDTKVCKTSQNDGRESFLLTDLHQKCPVRDVATFLTDAERFEKIFPQ
jgi:hypothetical protein